MCIMVICFLRFFFNDSREVFLKVIFGSGMLLLWNCFLVWQDFFDNTNNKDCLFNTNKQGDIEDQCVRY